MTQFDENITFSCQKGKNFDLLTILNIKCSDIAICSGIRYTEMEKECREKRKKEKKNEVYFMECKWAESLCEKRI